jgi:REP element-mobilizing transposase RayT
MVLASHVIFGAYGFWLPNDPRGSWSDFVGSWELFRFGPATKTTETRSLAHRSHDRSVRLAAKAALKRSAVHFNEQQIACVARGLEDYARRAQLAVLACAVMPDHVHLVLARHRLNVEPLAIQLKAAATRRLNAEGLHPFSNGENCFARGQWKVFLDSPEVIHLAIKYVELNPSKEELPSQPWPFLTPYV